MAGELNIAIAGQTAIVRFHENQIVVQVESMKLAKTMLRSHLPDLVSVGKALRFLDVNIQARLGERRAIEIFPNPNWLVRFFVPQARTLARAAKG